MLTIFLLNICIWNIRNVATIQTILPHLHETDSWKPFSGRTSTYVFYIFKILRRQGTSNYDIDKVEPE